MLTNHKLFFLGYLLLLSQLVSSTDVEQEAVLLTQTNEQNLNGAGHYKHAIEVSNGIKSSADGDVNGVHGEYFLPGEDGHPPIHVTYTADSTGFHAEVH